MEKGGVDMSSHHAMHAFAKNGNIAIPNYVHVGFGGQFWMDWRHLLDTLSIESGVKKLVQNYKMVHHDPLTVPPLSSLAWNFIVQTRHT
jgi:hypothetical protein